MKLVRIGKLVNTHGIKGEVKILSDFDKKDRIFYPGFILYINNSPYKITSYRHHKMFEMVTFEGFNNINDVLFLKGKEVYINRDDLKLDTNEYIYDDLINLEVTDGKKVLGKVDSISYNNGNNLLFIKGDESFYIPLNDHFIKKVDLDNNKLFVENTEGLILWK